MTTLLDQFGRPMSTTALAAPQTARVATLQHWTISTVIDGLTPACRAADR